MLTCIIFLTVLSIGLNSAIGIVRATYYDYGTCQFKNLAASGTILSANRGHTSVCVTVI